MSILSIVLVLAFATILCIVEIPKMKENKEYKELIIFSIILGYGVIITILKCLDVTIPNPSDLIAFIYSPIVDLMKSALE